MRTSLKEKVALGTGASSGLGARFARVLAANGALTVPTAQRLTERRSSTTSWSIRTKARIFRRAGGRPADDCALEAATRVAWPNCQHRLDCRPARAARYRRVLHEQGGGDSCDAIAGGRVGRYGINVNAICPGYIRTEMNDAVWDTERGAKLLDRLPRKRVGTVEELDGVLLLLVAEESQFH